jgi:GT2 family glycosyltransferase
MDTEISVIIPNWNGMSYLEDCLGSLEQQDFSSYEVVVVDNGSTDGSVEFMKRHFPKTKIIGFKENLGFSRAVNQGIKRAKGKYILLLNNDVEVDPRLLSQLHNAVTALEDADFCACRMMDFRRRELIDGVGDGFPRKGKAFRIGHGAKYGTPFDQRRRVFGACAGAALYKKALFERVGFFDEDFFAYHEDADWNFRANLMGYRCFYIPEAVVYHMGSSTTGSLHNEFTVFYNIRNIIGVIVKNMPMLLLVKLFPRIMWGQVEGFLRYCVVYGYWMAYFSGLFGAVKLGRKMLEKRAYIQRKRSIATSQLERLFIASEREGKGQIRYRQIHEANGN